MHETIPHFQEMFFFSLKWFEVSTKSQSGDRRLLGPLFPVPDQLRPAFFGKVRSRKKLQIAISDVPLQILPLNQGWKFQADSEVSTYSAIPAPILSVMSLMACRLPAAANSSGLSAVSISAEQVPASNCEGH